MIEAYRRMSTWWQHITGKHTSSSTDQIRVCVNVNMCKLGIAPLEAPPRSQKTLGCCSAQAAAFPVATFDSRMEEMVLGMKNMEISIHSHINDAVAASLAIQSRGNPTVASSPPTERETFVPHPSLLKMLRNFFNNPSATFKTPQQAEALEITVTGDRHLMLVGPTAMGKTLVYMLPAAQRDHGITCVLLPLSALHLDFDRRCKDLHIQSSRWLPGTNEQPRTRIVYVSPEHAQTSTFINYLISTSRLNLLVQFVIDEAHLVKFHSDFRFCFSALRPLITSGENASKLI